MRKTLLEKMRKLAAGAGERNTVFDTRSCHEAAYFKALWAELRRDDCPIFRLLSSELVATGPGITTDFIEWMRKEHPREAAQMEAVLTKVIGILSRGR
jgi:hypothetical protein